MLQKKWFKLFIWISASAFFFLSAAVIISYFNPEPGEKEIMSYMSGMMGAMGSTMGLSMALEQDSYLSYIIAISAKITMPLMAIAFLSGLILKIRRLKVDK